MNTRPHSTWMFKALIVVVTAILLASQPLFPILAGSNTPAARPTLNAPAATLTVTSTANSGAGTLRQAIADANSGDMIDFSLTYPAVITLTSGQLSITKNLTINGPGADSLIVRGVNINYVFYITSTVTISGVTIANGHAPSDSGGGIFNESGTLTLNHITVRNNAGSTSGGGIRNISGTLTLNHSTVMSNTASNGGGIYNQSGVLTLTDSTIRNNTGSSSGGGIFNESGALTLNHSTVIGNVGGTSGGGIRTISGTLTLNHSTVMSNTASNGGGVWNISGTLMLNNSTLVRNTVEYGGGGLYNQSGVLTLTDSTVMSNTAGFGGGLLNTRGGTVVLNNSTVSGNLATGTNEYDGGGAIDQWYETSTLILNNSTIAHNTAANPNRTESGIWLESGVLTMTNSIVANNAITNNLTVESGATFTSQGYNLSNNWNGLPIQGTDKTGDPRLSPVADNGGPTWTHALQAGSPAIDAGNDATCPTIDQRGVVRPQGPHCDIGAFEVNQYTLTINTAGNGSGGVTPTVGSHSYISGTNVPLTATANTDSTFAGWSGDADCTDSSVTMNANKICSATFTLNTFVITPTAGVHGSIMPGTPQTVDYGSSITFTITPDAGYHSMDVGVDGVSQGAVSSYTFTNVTADHIITATFALNPPTGLGASNDSPTALGSVTTLTATVTDGLNVTYTWNFGDGSFGADATVTHTYPVTGSYTAGVTATNSAGSLTALTTVHVITVEPYRCLLPLVLK